MGLRKNYRHLTVSERTRFIEALHHVKFWGVVGQFADLHESHFSHGIHRTSHFLAWHREFLLRFENKLREKHADVAIPYWDSTVDRSPSDPLWSNTFIGQFDSAWNLKRALGASSQLPTTQQVETNQGRPSYDVFWAELEGPIHNPPHPWVGGLMGGVRSPEDPVFYMHHCWIDLLWARWQQGHSGAPFVSSGAGFGVDDPLMGYPDRTPRSVLSHHVLGYAYDTDRLQSFRAVNFPTYYIRHRNFLGELTQVSSPLDRRDATFTVVAGLADPNAVSFRATNFSNYFLRHQGFRLRLQPFSNDDLYRRDATFSMVPGLADPSKVSFRSLNYPGHHIRHRNFSLYLEAGSDSLYRSDSTFQLTNALWRG